MYVAGIKVFYRGGILKRKDNVNFQAVRGYASVLSKARGLFPTDRCRENEWREAKSVLPRRYSETKR